MADFPAQTLLQKIPYFHALEAADLTLIWEEVIVRAYQPGEIIFLEGDPNAGLLLVVEGQAKIYRLSPDGKEHILAILRPGDSCNEVPVVDDGPNPANLAAVSAVVAWVISGEAMHRLRDKIPALNTAIINSLAMRCRQLVHRVYILSFLSVTGRLADFLWQQSQHQAYLDRHRWTQDEIAAHLGTVREMVGRACRELQAANLIRLDRHRIEIIDREGLKAIK
jgi:CRP/FNR family transcriptional regulator